MHFNGPQIPTRVISNVTYTKFLNIPEDYDLFKYYASSNGQI